MSGLWREAVFVVRNELIDFKGAVALYTPLFDSSFSDDLIHICFYISISSTDSGE
jgi:hypothetical protein